MNIIYETTKERGATILIPTAMVDTINPASDLVAAGLCHIEGNARRQGSCIIMPSTSQGDAFALRNSGLDQFLFAEVGTELNGSSLTVLSTLARLGKDPWLRPRNGPGCRAAMVAGLTQSIGRCRCARALSPKRARQRDGLSCCCLAGRKHWANRKDRANCQSDARGTEDSSVAAYGCLLLSS